MAKVGQYWVFHRRSLDSELGTGVCINIAVAAAESEKDYCIEIIALVCKYYSKSNPSVATDSRILLNSSYCSLI